MLSILTFAPYYKSVIWGGERIAQFKGIPSQGTDIGESWEISPMQGHESVVDAGPFKGMTLNRLVDQFPEELLGRSVNARWPRRFPLLVKIIDSNDDLSIQVHPDDALAAERHNSLGKTEMWYSLAPAPDAYLYAGFNRRIDSQEYRRCIADNTIVETLGKYFVRPGDVFFLPAGCVHAIGRGNLVVEIQEASDITYRIYDYDRRDAQGNPRQLHVEESVGAVNFDCLQAPAKNVIPAPGTTEVLEKCEYFTTAVSAVDGELALPLADRDSFTVLMGLSGHLTLSAEDGTEVAVTPGRSVLIPACVNAATLCGNGTVLTSHVD